MRFFIISVLRPYAAAPGRERVIPEAAPPSADTIPCGNAPAGGQISQKPNGYEGEKREKYAIIS